MKKTITTILAITAITVAAAVAQPGRGDGQGPRNEGGKPKREMLNRLDLTPEQQQALRDLRREQQEQMIDLRAAAQKARLNVEKLLDAETVDTEALMAAVESAGQAEIAIEKARVAHHLKVREIVGVEKAAQMRGMMQGRRGDRDGGPGGPGQGRGPGGEGF